MLNADIAFAHCFEHNQHESRYWRSQLPSLSTGAGDLPTCPYVEGAIQDVARYQFSNEAWLIDFENALCKMINKGYVITTNCVDKLCELAKA